MNLSKFYACGGTVRDELLGQKPKDMDFVCLVPSFDAMREEILKAGGEIFIEKPEFQVIRGKLPKIGASDFVLPRKEGGYSDGRRPDNTEITDSLYEDSLRRDFKVNAMYKNLETGEILDFHNGKQDLKDKTLSCVGNAVERFEEDHLRILRAMRFFIVKGFDLDGEIDSCLAENDELLFKIRDVSKERVYEELRKCFEYDTWETLKFLEVYYSLQRAIFEDNVYGIGLGPSINNK